MWRKHLRRLALTKSTDAFFRCQKWAGLVIQICDASSGLIGSLHGLTPNSHLTCTHVMQEWNLTAWFDLSLLCTFNSGTGLRMQSLLRNVCRAGSRGAAASLLEFAAPVATQPAASQSSSAIQYLRTYGFSRPIGVGFWLEIHAVGIPLSPC